MNNEIWKELEEFDGKYLVSTLGRVKSMPNSHYKTERILKGIIDKGGYLRVDLSKKGISKRYRIHRLIAEAFIPNPNNYEQVNHINENKLDNSVENLEWCTSKQNCNHGTRILRIKRTRHFKNPWIKKPVIAIKNNKVAMHFSSIQRAAKYGLQQSAICRCCNHKKGCNSYKGYTWEYEENYANQKGEIVKY